jgi:hypothetical protein
VVTYSGYKVCLIGKPDFLLPSILEKELVDNLGFIFIRFLLGD